MSKLSTFRAFRTDKPLKGVFPPLSFCCFSLSVMFICTFNTPFPTDITPVPAWEPGGAGTGTGGIRNRSQTDPIREPKLFYRQKNKKQALKSCFTKGKSLFQIG